MIKKINYIILAFVMLTTQNLFAQNYSKIDRLFEKKLEHSLISKGNNFPDFSETKDSIDYLLFAMHENISISDFTNKTGYTKVKVDSLLRFLEEKNWLHKINNNYKPTVFIATDKEGGLLYKYAEPISKEITKSIQKKLPEIKRQFQKTEISKSQAFEDWSFLILSNVLLDSWQIDNVEKRFLNKLTRPLRHGNHYYYKIDENVNEQIESFGIYGNQTETFNGNKISIYGNNRIGIDVKSTTHVISKQDNEILKDMASSYLPNLLDILGSRKSYFKTIYKKLGYSKEISFEEFFIWWYHFIYTQATNEMREKGIVVIPQTGNFDYSIKN
jgi:DNA-binding MarR family transcriptional regulator